MRAALIVTVVILSLWAVAGPRSGPVAAPGGGLLHAVSQLLSCDASAVGQTSSDPRGLSANPCGSQVGTLATQARSIAGRAGAKLPPAVAIAPGR
jgi:hypothetical protein